MGEGDPMSTPRWTTDIRPTIGGVRRSTTWGARNSCSEIEKIAESHTMFPCPAHFRAVKAKGNTTHVVFLDDSGQEPDPSWADNAIAISGKLARTVLVLFYAPLARTRWGAGLTRDL